MVDAFSSDAIPTEDPSEVYVLARERAVLAALLDRGWQAEESAQLPELRPWTDDYANVLAALWARGFTRAAPLPPVFGTSGR